MDILEGLQWLREQLQRLTHPDKLRELVNLWGPPWVSYVILFGIVFAETGLLVGFFLPGDSLLFTAGVLASRGVFNIFLLIASLCVAAIVGDAVNYWLGARAGKKLEERVYEKKRSRWIKHSHLLAAKAFYEKHGGVAIILARFVPLVRTFTPFVAGVAQMSYRQFAVYNVIGGIGWVLSMTVAGYTLGKIKWVSENFELVVIGIVALSLVPVLIGVYRAWRHKPLLDARPPDDAAPETKSTTPENDAVAR